MRIQRSHQVIKAILLYRYILTLAYFYRNSCQEEEEVNKKTASGVLGQETGINSSDSSNPDVDCIREKQEISVGFVSEYSDSMNLYQGMNTNPYNFTDPFGEELRDMKNRIVYYQTHVSHKFKHLSGEQDKGYSEFMFTNKLNLIIVTRRKNQTEDQKTNCIGFAMADGKVWIHPDQVDTMLADDYKKIGAPKKGAIAVYRDLEGNVVHAGKVDGVKEGVTVSHKGGVGSAEENVPVKDAWSLPHTVEYHKKKGIRRMKNKRLAVIINNVDRKFNGFRNAFNKEKAEAEKAGRPFNPNTFINDFVKQYKK